MALLAQAEDRLRLRTEFAARLIEEVESYFFPTLERLGMFVEVGDYKKAQDWMLQGKRLLESVQETEDYETFTREWRPIEGKLQGFIQKYSGIILRTREQSDEDFLAEDDEEHLSEDIEEISRYIKFQILRTKAEYLIEAFESGEVIDEEQMILYYLFDEASDIFFDEDEFDLDAFLILFEKAEKEGTPKDEKKAIIQAMQQLLPGEIQEKSFEELREEAVDLHRLVANLSGDCADAVMEDMGADICTEERGCFSALEEKWRKITETAKVSERHRSVYGRISSEIKIMLERIIELNTSEPETDDPMILIIYAQSRIDMLQDLLMPLQALETLIQKYDPGWQEPSLRRLEKQCRDLIEESQKKEELVKAGDQIRLAEQRITGRLMEASKKQRLQEVIREARRIAEQLKNGGSLENFQKEWQKLQPELS